VLIAVIVFGFAYLYQQNASLETRLTNIELSKQLPTQATTSEPTEKNEPNAQETTIPKGIPSAIIFETKSNSTLSPQASIIVTIESVVEQENKTIDVNVKTFTSKATSYTALDMQNLISVMQKDGTTTKSSSTTTIWKSMPPKSFVTGVLSFPLLKDQRTVLVRIDTGTEVKFFSFDLDKKTYKEVTQ